MSSGTPERRSTPPWATPSTSKPLAVGDPGRYAGFEFLGEIVELGGSVVSPAEDTPTAASRQPPTRPMPQFRLVATGAGVGSGL